MGPRTRSVASSPVKQPAVGASTATTKPAYEPRTILLLPKDLSSDARLLLLPHPRDGLKKRFLLCPSKGLFEFTQVAADPTDYRSILISDGPKEEQKRESIEPLDDCTGHGYVKKEAIILVATPFDLFFLLLPLLPSSLRSSAKLLFQPFDDLMEAHILEDKHLKHFVQQGKGLIEKRLAAFCDIIDAGDEKMFRVNEEKVLSLILQKAKNVVTNGLPASMEERFVTRMLEAPVLSVKREQLSISTLEQSTPPREDEEMKTESSDSQSTADSAAPSSVFSEVSIASSVTMVAPDPVSQRLKHLQRTKTALDFIMAAYIPSTLSESIQAKFKDTKLLADFEPLDQHLQRLAELKAEAAASRSLSDFSRKRGNEDDDEAAEERSEKKRRIVEEEKKKKIGESRGVRELKKVNVTGMKRMSDFFGKKPSAAKANEV